MWLCMKKNGPIILILMLLLLSGCFKKDEGVKDADNIEGKQNDVEDKSPVQTNENTFPLTGEKTNESIDNRIVGVMVNNHPAARPQSGLSQADLVFEILAEGSTTRFLALFQSEQPEVVGPVRSARQYYFDLTKGMGGLYIYHGAADVVQDIVDSRDIDYLNGSIYDNDGYLFKREAFRKAPHNSYLQFGAVYDVAESKGYEMKLEPDRLPFIDESEAINGEEASHMVVMYPNKNEQTGVEYVYNEQSEAYGRYENQEPTKELNSEVPIEIDNVFVIETYHEVIDKQGRRAIDIDSGGTAYLLQNGKVEALEWENHKGRIVPVKDGQSVGFVPGKTWINVVPTNPGLEQSVKIWNNEKEG